MTTFRDDPGLPTRVDAIEAAAWSSLARIRDSGDEFDVETVSGITVSIFPGQDGANRVYGLGLERPAQPEMIDAIIDAYRNHGVPEFSLHICPTARPPTLRRMLEDRSFSLESREAVLFRLMPEPDGVDPFFQIRAAEPEDAPRVAAVLKSARAAEVAWTDVVTRTPGYPGWHVYMAFHDHEPYAVFPMFIQDEAAWLGPVSTLPEFRGRGTESAMLAHGLAQARNLGCLWATTHFDVGLRARPRNFARNGFELLYLRSRYVWRAEQAGDSPIGSSS